MSYGDGSASAYRRGGREVTATEVIEVMIIDDHAVFTESLATALNRQDGITVVATSSGDDGVVGLAVQ